MDRLTDLGDELFHAILSRLDLKDVARVSVVSKRCSELCMSTPFWNMVVRNFRDQNEISTFAEFRNRFLKLHRGDNNIVGQLRVEICCENLGVGIGNFIRDHWISEAIMCNVRKVVLVLDKIGVLLLTENELGCNSLRELEVSLGPSGSLILPTSTKFGGLENLTLKHLRVSIMSPGEWISSCKTLKMLRLVDVAFMDDKLNITSSSLEDLVIEDVKGSALGDINIKVSAKSLQYLRIVWNGDPRQLQVHSLTLYAPNLQKLSWVGRVSHYCFEGNFESLRYSDISIVARRDSSRKGIIAKAIQTISQVSSIRISDYCIKGILLRGRLPIFHNLRSLTLIRTGLANEIPSRVALLNSTPHLNVLKIGLRQYGYSSYSLVEKHYNALYWESQNLEFVHSVKEVEMEIKGEQDEMELIKYLLRNAQALAMMTIRYSSRGFHKDSLMFEMIENSQKASSFVIIIVRPI